VSLILSFSYLRLMFPLEKSHCGVTLLKFFLTLPILGVLSCDLILFGG